MLAVFMHVTHIRFVLYNDGCENENLGRRRGYKYCKYCGSIFVELLHSFIHCGDPHRFLAQSLQKVTTSCNALHNCSIHSEKL